MRFIVGRKQINLSRLMVFVLSAIVALSGTSLGVKAAEVRSGNSRRTFADWCRQKADLSPQAKHTVEVLLKKAETTECDAANQKLSTLTELDLDNNYISDIKPLESLTNLTSLDLGNNQITDIKPLESLTSLTSLDLGNNQIIDITHNQIRDIKPLASLTNLTVLDLNHNRISDIKPLESLTKLIRLNLSGNPIAPKTCPLKPESICKWEP